MIPNMVEIAKALLRPPTYTTKFFGCELGSQVTIDLKNEKYIVNGAHEAEKLQNLLDGFISKFVLCPSCLNPETTLEITKDEVIFRNCKACGAVKPVDMRHRLTAFILKNPETAKKSKKDKKSKKSGSNDASELPTPEATHQNSQDEDDADDDELTRRINAEAANLPQTSQLDDGWAEDTSPEAVARRMKELQVEGAVEMLMEDEEDDNPLDEFADFVTLSESASSQEIYDKAFSLEIRNDRACAILAQILFDAAINEKQIEKHVPTLNKFMTSEKAQKAFLGGIERLVCKIHKELLPKVPVILKLIYDADLVDEEVFLSWAEKPSKKYVDRASAKEVRLKAQPFLKWLQEAEEDDSSEEEE